MLQTEFEFMLPKGYVDNDGNLHREGIMRLANASDEIAPLQDPRVQRNGAYMSVIVLSRVIMKLGSLPDINPTTIEHMFAADVSYLQDFYRRINSNGNASISISCPHCEGNFDVDERSLFDGGPLGESSATP